MSKNAIILLGSNETRKNIPFYVGMGREKIGRVRRGREGVEE